MVVAPPTVPGNRLALAGAIWYLLEIPLVFPFVGATAPAISKTAELVSYYSSQKSNLLIGAAVASVVLLGRIAFSAGARASFHRTPGVRALADLGLGTMVLSVVFEIGSMALYASAGRMAAGGGDPAGIVALHYAADTIGFLVMPATAVAVAATSLAQIIAAQSARWLGWLGWLGLVSGVLGIVSSVYMAATALEPQAAGFLTTWVLGFWIWMIATGAVLFRRTVGQSAQPAGA
jgi:hypothetical protein